MKSNQTSEASAKFSKQDLMELEAIERIKAGDKQAFDLIHKRYYRFIKHRCFLSVRDYHLAKDMASEILTKIYLNIDKYVVRYTFNSWVTSIASNYIVDHVRKSKNEPISMNRNVSIVNHDSQSQSDTDSDSYVMYSNRLDSGSKNPEELMQERKVQKMRNKFVMDLLAGLKERERMIIIHYYFDEMSYQEIADKLNIGLSNMKVTLMNSKKKLKNKIGDYSSIASLFAA